MNTTEICDNHPSIHIPTHVAPASQSLADWLHVARNDYPIIRFAEQLNERPGAAEHLAEAAGVSAVVEMAACLHEMQALYRDLADALAHAAAECSSFVGAVA